MNKEQEVDIKQFRELHDHPGSKNYEVFEIIPKRNKAEYFLIDSISNIINVDSYFKSPSNNKKDRVYSSLKLDLMGNVKDDYEIHTVLNDGTMRNNRYYSNWIINGDTTKHKYIDPFTNNEIMNPYEHKWEEQDYEKWLSVFKRFYEKAAYVYLDTGIWFYYFKIEDKWYFLDTYIKRTPLDFTEQYPPKEDKDVRMIQPENLAPVWYRKAAKEDKSPLIKMRGYESAYFEEVDKGAFSYGYSAGWWYLEIYMPLGDTLRIKRYSDYQDPKLQLYKIPAANGGRNDVLFIVQRPEEIFPLQVGGMYVIRPRNLDQPERRYDRYSTVTHPDGRVEVTRAEETEAYKKWKAKR